jgi:glycosyltransferase involved in cell wall biosynthesis
MSQNFSTHDALAPSGGSRHPTVALSGSPAQTARLRALVIAHDARAKGGVNNFLRIMRRKMRSRVDVSRFANGRRHLEQGKVATVKRLAYDYLRFAVLLTRRRFDVVHLNPTLDLSSLPREMAFAWLAKLVQPKAKVLLFYRGWDWTALEAIRASGWKRMMFLATHRRVDRVLLLSSIFKDALVAEGVQCRKIHVVSTMFEGDKLRPVLERVPTKEPQMLVFMSRFLPAKGGAATIEAFGEIAAEFPGARLIMAGDGPDMPRLCALTQDVGLEDRIDFVGYVGGETKMELLARARLFILPTAHPEGMPNAVLEAMAAGDVIITTPIGGITDVVEDGANGSLLRSPEAKSVAAEIRRYLEDPELAAAIGARNSEKAWRLWESGVVAERIRQHYIDVALEPSA